MINIITPYLSWRCDRENVESSMQSSHFIFESRSSAEINMREILAGIYKNRRKEFVFVFCCFFPMCMDGASQALLRKQTQWQLKLRFQSMLLNKRWKKKNLFRAVTIQELILLLFSWLESGNYWIYMNNTIQSLLEEPKPNWVDIENREALLLTYLSPYWFSLLVLELKEYEDMLVRKHH